MKKTILFIMTLFVFTTQSCLHNDFPKGNIGNYYFISSYSSGGKGCHIFSRGLVIIDSEIVGLIYDSTFIIVKQKPYNNFLDSICKVNPDYKLREMNKLFKKYKKHNYWIIDKREEMECYRDTINESFTCRNISFPIYIYTKSIYGPFSYEEYLEKRREFNVPDSLKLMARKEVKHFKLLNDIFCKPEYIVVE
jgi:hypothetical protein